MGTEIVKVLLIEDQPLCQKAVTTTLDDSETQYDVAVTGNLTAGIEMTQGSSFDVVVLDLNLPDSKGRNTVIRLHEAAPDLPIVVWSFLADETTICDILHLGAQEYLTKDGESMAALPRKLGQAIERKSLDLTLKHGSDRWRALFDNNPMETIVVDREGCITDINAAKRGSGGRTPALGVRMYVDYAAQHEIDMRAELMQCIETGEKRVFPEQNYGHKVLSVMISPFSIDNQYGAVITSQDITERKQAEENSLALEAKLRHSQKLEAIGTLAGGVAHEINNPINGIMNYAQLILDTLGPDSPVSGFAEEIGKETVRVSDIVKSLLSFASPAVKRTVTTRMCDVIASSLSLIRTVLLSDRITLEIDVPEDLPRLKCRSQQIQQVLMNLVTNARDSLREKYPKMDKDKLIRITAKVLEKDGEQWIRTTVEDHGAGIPAQELEHLFDPFYTSKRPDRGTGLGLSISHTIVTEHAGEISVESKVGEWTRFHVDLPTASIKNTKSVRGSKER